MRLEVNHTRIIRVAKKVKHKLRLVLLFLELELVRSVGVGALVAHPITPQRSRLIYTYNGIYNDTGSCCYGQTT